jgi:hypothetical protein
MTIPEESNEELPEELKESKANEAAAGDEWQEKQDAIEEKAESILKEDGPEYFFEYLAEQSWDRPSAFWFYCAIVGIPKEQQRELDMHGYAHKIESKEQEANIREEYEYLVKVFGRPWRIPPILLSNEFDT